MAFGEKIIGNLDHLVIAIRRTGEVVKHKEIYRIQKTSEVYLVRSVFGHLANLFVVIVGS